MGTVVFGTKPLKLPPFEGADRYGNSNGKIVLKQPVSLARFGKSWLLTDGGQCAVMMLVDGKPQVIAGTCSSGVQVRGFRDGDGGGGGQGAMFNTLSGIVSDGKRYAYVADIGNNSVRRLDISELAGQ